jgi:hypothetical protein
MAGSTKSGETFESLEEWHRRHTAAHEASLGRLERRRDLLAAELKAVIEEEAAALAAAGGYNPYELIDDLLTEEALVDEVGLYKLHPAYLFVCGHHVTIPVSRRIACKRLVTQPLSL